MGSRCVKFGVIALTLSYWSLEVQHGTSWQKELSEDVKKIIVALHKDGVGYNKIAKTLKLSCSTVAKTIQRSNRTGSTQNRPRHGWPKKLSGRAQHHIQRLCLGNRRKSAASIASDVEGVGGQPVSAQTAPHTASNWSAWLSSQKEASSNDDAQESRQTCVPVAQWLDHCVSSAKVVGSIPKEHTYWQYKCIAWMHCKSLWIKASAKCINVNVNSLLKTSKLRTWITGTVVWWDQDKLIWFRWCQVCVVATRWGVQRQVCLAYGQAWWWECHGLGMHECCRHWGATVPWGNHEGQHVLWHTEAEHDPLPLETGPRGSILTW